MSTTDEDTSYYYNDYQTGDINNDIQLDGIHFNSLNQFMDYYEYNRQDQTLN